MADLKNLPQRITYFQSSQKVEDDDIAQISEIFKSYDTTGRGKVPIEHFPTIIRLLNNNIGEEESSELQCQVDKKNRGYFTFNQLLEFLEEFKFVQDTEEQLLIAFQELDHDADGFIPKEEMVQYLSSMGEVFNNEELNEFIRIATVVVQNQKFVDEEAQQMNSSVVEQEMIDIQRIVKIMFPVIDAKQDLLKRVNKNTPTWLSAPEFRPYNELEVTDTSIKISWFQGLNSGFSFGTVINKCERLQVIQYHQSNFTQQSAITNSKLAYYPMIGNDTSFITEYSLDKYWQNCVSITLTSMRTSYSFSGLTQSNAYRFRVMHTSTLNGNSDWSQYLIISTRMSLSNSKYQYSTLYARGTGVKNHASSIVKVDSTVLFENIRFRGLNLIVLERTTLKKVFSQSYDLMEYPSTVTVNSQPFYPYTLSLTSMTVSNGTATTSTYTKSDQIVISHNMAQKILSYNSNYFIVIVSNNAWEHFFSRELGETIMSCGGFNIMEFINHYSINFGEKTKQRNLDDSDPFQNTNFYHPFAFIGIPGLLRGKGFEQLRQNQGFFLNLGTVPYAEVLVQLQFNNYIGMYTFAQQQFMSEYHFHDTFESIFYNKDRSLYSVYQYLAAVNMTSYNDWKTSIYNPQDLKVYPTNTGQNYTIVDTMYLPAGVYPIRYDQKGGRGSSTSLVEVSSKSYYNFVQYFLYTDNVRDCPPPYTDFTNKNCFDTALVSPLPPIFQCYIGLLPYYCSGVNTNIANAFNGYL